MNIARFRKAVVAALPSLVALGVVVLRERLGLTLSEAEVQLLYVALSAVGVTTTAGVYTVPNAPKK